MGIADILKKEASEKGRILLFKEGIFWRAYEESALLFTKHIKAYQLTKKFFKNVGCEVVFCGFPSTTLNELLANLSSKEVIREERIISIASFEPVENKVFTDWKDGIPIFVKESEPEHSVCDSGYSNNEVVLQRIRNFRVASSTPIECQQFLMEMQKQLDGTV